MDIYEPAEDSYLLEKQIKKYAAGRVLDVGTGSGIQALTAVTFPNIREVVAVDINQKAVEELQKIAEFRKLRKLKVLHSDLFEKVEAKFNLILFNPPYLPQDRGIDDPALYGGKKGWEIIERLISQASRYLMEDGKILLLFSTLTNKKKVEEILEEHLFEWKQVASQKLSFEELFVYEIQKTELLRELERHHLEGVEYFARGKRGVVYKAVLQKGKLIKTHFPSQEELKKTEEDVVVKVERGESKAIERISNEAKWLKKLNQHGIGPRLFLYQKSYQKSYPKSYLILEFIEGELILDWIQKKETSKSEIREVLVNILRQCFALDELGVNKGEMHHPLKHVIVNKKNRPVMIDFERCKETDKPQNVTQFVEFISRIKQDLAKKDFSINSEELQELGKEYKTKFSESSLEKIIKQFS